MIIRITGQIFKIKKQSQNMELTNVLTLFFMNLFNISFSSILFIML